MGQPDEGSDDGLPKRERWSRAIDFLLACVGFSVGLGNVWRFPYLCYKNGGGAFLIPYMIAIFLGGIPLFFMEVCIGQMMRRGGIEAWNMVPIAKGIGYAQILIVFYLSCYYNVIIAWAFYYLFASFTSMLPWSNCDNDWNTKTNCTVIGKDTNLTSNMVDSVTEFWEYKVLGISEGIENIGTIKWDLALCLLLAWLVVFLCIIKGIKSSGKVMYVTATSPYIFMLVLLIRAAFLDGAADGVRYYMVADFSRLSDITVWVDAGTQIFFSMSISLGTLPALGSYNKFTHNTLRDCFLFAVVNSFTSIFAGFVIFMTLGFMSKLSGIPIDKVAESGPGLAFIAYPKALAQMPIAPLWSVFFFIMVILLGLDSQFVGVEGFVTAIADMFPKFMNRKWHREIFTGITCMFMFFIGLSMVTNGGMYVFQLFDYYSGSRIILVIAAIQSLAIAYVYGVRRFARNIRKMFWFPKPIAIFFQVLWALLSPAYVMIIFILSTLAYSTLTYTRGTTRVEYTFPNYSVIIGWVMAGISCAFVPGVILYKYCTYKGSTKERFKQMITPEYSPDSPFAQENADDEPRKVGRRGKKSYEMEAPPANYGYGSSPGYAGASGNVNVGYEGHGYGADVGGGVGGGASM